MTGQTTAAGARTEILTGDDLVFARRMLPHFLAGKSPAESAQSILEDDIRILNETFANNRRGVEAGIFSELSARVHALAKTGGAK